MEQKHPQLAVEFHNGKFVVHKSSRQFSAMAIDQAHEQANAVIKGDGGAIGVTEDPSALRRWMVAGPEVSHLVAQYEAASESKDATEHNSHHEQTERAQTLFFERVDKLSSVMKEMGNPFQEESMDLLTLDTKDIADRSAADMVGTHHERGKTRLEDFMKGLESEDECTFYAPIKKNKTNFFRQEPVPSNPKQKVLKEDCQLFSKLCISCQSRECDLQDFFRHENQPFPAALSDNGKLHTGQKAHLAAILEAKTTTPDNEPEADAMVIDGSALVNALPPRTSKTFEDYAALDFLPRIEAYSSKYKRTDIVFDVYRPSSLKSETRSKRGRGARRRVTAKGKLPQNWGSFLRDDDNKTELFHFLADKIAEMSTTNTVVVTKGEDALSNQMVNLDELAPCNHEEADTRIFVHARHAATQGSKVLMVKANDTDVVVIAVSALPTLKELGLQHLWIAFGQGQNLRYIPIHDLISTLGPEKTRGMLFFHAFTGCDVVSAFRLKGKKSAWLTWDVCPEASDVFAKLSHYPPMVEDDDLEILEKFVVTMYDRSSTAAGVDAARLELFARKQRPYEAIPPTQAALLQHAKRAAYQAGCIWSQSTVRQPETPTPADWGWKQQGNLWQVCWTTLPPIASSCQELTKCGCKTECRGRCKCYRLSLTCTALCSCKCQD